MENFDLNKVRQAAEIMREFGLKKLDISDNGTHLMLEKPDNSTENLILPTQMKRIDEIEEASEPKNEAAKNIRIFKSPVVGTIYLSPSPESPSFVKEGDYVENGDVVCIIEAMKMFNELKINFSGKVTKICVENGAVVEYNQPLFEIEILKKTTIIDE